MRESSVFSRIQDLFRRISQNRERAINNAERQTRTESSPNDIELVRVIDRTIHVSPIDRQKEVDYVISNPTDQEFNFVFLPLRQFERDLEAFDEDDRKLNIYPNRVVNGWLDKIKAIDHKSWAELQHQFKHTKYKLLIQLPRDRPIKPGDYRTITLTFEQSDAVEFHGITEPSVITGWWGKWYRKFFRIPTFVANVERFPGHPQDVFINIIGPPGYRVNGTTERTEAELARDLYENGFGDDTRVATARIPPPKDERYIWDLDYELVPNNVGLMKMLAVYLIVTLFAGGVSVVMAFEGIEIGPNNLIQSISGGFITASLGLIFALDYEWASRYRVLSVIPLLIHGIAWALWQFV